MKLLLFGGSFDPPHIGHIALLNQAVHAVQPDAVVVMPAAVPPHKQAGNTPAALRFAMCECFCRAQPGAVISRLELERSGKSYTWDTVQQLSALYQNAHIYLCVGGDMLTSFFTWYHYEDLLRTVSLVAHRRTQHDGPAFENALQQLRAAGADIIVPEGPVVPVSSTWLRAQIQAGRDVEEYLPPPVAEVIRSNGLYQNKS